MADSREYLIALLKEKYDYELNRKKVLDDALTMPITLLSFIVGVLYFMLSQIPDQLLNCNEQWVKWILSISLLLAASMSFIYLYKVFFGYRRFYCSFPNSDEVIASYYKLVDRHKLVRDADIQEEYIISDIKEYQIIWYKDCNQANTEANDKRGDAFFIGRMWLGISMIICILLMIFIYYIKSYNGKQTSNTTATSAASSP